MKEVNEYIMREGYQNFVISGISRGENWWRMIKLKFCKSTSPNILKSYSNLNKDAKTVELSRKETKIFLEWENLKKVIKFIFQQNIDKII